MAANERLKEMPMATRLILCAMTHESDCAFSGKSLKQAEREFLAMILDCAATLVDWTIQK